VALEVEGCPGLPVLRQPQLGSHHIYLQVCNSGVTYAPEAKGDMPVRPAFRMVGALVGVTSRFAQNRTLSGKGHEIRPFHKRRYSDELSPLRQI